MKQKQLGYLNIPDGTFETLGVLALVGLVSIVGALAYAAYWLVTHVRFV